MDDVDARFVEPARLQRPLQRVPGVLGSVDAYDNSGDANIVLVYAISDDRHRACGVVQTLLAHRSEEESAHGSEPAGSDDEQIGAVRRVQQSGNREVVHNGPLDRDGVGTP